MRLLAAVLAAIALAGCADVDTVTSRPSVGSGVATPEPGLASWPSPVGLEALRFVVAADEQARVAWWTEVATPPVTRTTTAPRRSTAPRVPRTQPQFSGRCGGPLPPCWVLDRESGYNDGNPYTYNIRAYNPTGCGGRGCYGKWQCDPRSCRGTGTEAEQDAEAARLWDGGRGCAHWAAC